MSWNSSRILLIDPDEAAARELAELLANRSEPPKLWVAHSVASAEMILRSQAIDWLFIRIILWDDFQRLRPTLVHVPQRVVFLSGRNEKCTAHLSSALDGHLQPPYRPGNLVRIWNRWLGAGFIPLPLDIFFIKSRARFESVRYGDVWQVEVEGSALRVQTRHTDYRVSGSLQAFQDRLPVPLSMVRRGCLVNECYVGAASVRARS